MILKKLVSICSIALILFSFTGDKPAYQIFNEKGGISSYGDVLKSAQDADIILFGEQQDNPICHWLEIELAKDLYDTINDNLILGAEMFEADNQIIINEYLGGNHSYETFIKEVKVWENNKTDYQPLLDFSLNNQLTFVATNIPERYANIVAESDFKGLNGISIEAKKWIAPLPITYNKYSPDYVNAADKNTNNIDGKIAKAQALKDATMAHFILKNWTKGRTFLHYNSFNHSKKFEGIIWYLKQANPDLKIISIGTIEQEKIDSLNKENIGIANYTICTPTSMTNTY
jgi:uncharacterized iron-regulated protein